MATIASRLQLPPLRKQSMADLLARAEEMGMPPEDYARQLVEDGLALQRAAESTTISEIMGPVRKAAGHVDEAEIVQLVEKARTDYHRTAGRGKKK